MSLYTFNFEYIYILDHSIIRNIIPYICDMLEINDLKSNIE